MKRLHTCRPYSLIAASVFSTVLLACGPVFESRYKFSPPDSTAGYTCVNQCDVSRAQCRQIEDYEQRECTNRAQYEASTCRDSLYRYQNRTPKWHECSESSCLANYDQCETDYRSCYETCGGVVDSETICTSGCEDEIKQR